MTVSKNAHCHAHHRQVGWCAGCQRAALDARREQLRTAVSLSYESGPSRDRTNASSA